ncbi:MAG TPA: riboflavin synthase [Solirubrobacteraceae bacterium]|jgi:riboflavin synthase
MFTGLIADLGSVLALERADGGATLRIATRLAGELGEGDSIAVNGVCLTATAIDATSFAAQAMQETLRRSSLGALAVGGAVNLELALRADERLGGHIVQGHVDGTGTVAEIREEGFSRVLEIALDDSPAKDATADDVPAEDVPAYADAIRMPDADPEASLARYLVHKGSIAVDGVSLTISSVQDGGFSVSLIPETLQRTNLGRLEIGDRVNLEPDILAKHVERLMEARL